MKIRFRHEDFHVEEIPSTPPPAAHRGAFALYRMLKRGKTTPDAMGILERAWHIRPGALSFGGLKDRHAVTLQYLTIQGGRPGVLRQDGLEVEYLGQLPFPFTAAHIAGNRFHLVLRDIAPAQRPALDTALEEVRATGLANYFDDQRFGSVNSLEEGFIGLHLVKGQFEQALKLAMAGTYQHDPAEAKREKQLLLDHWGDWQFLLDNLPRGHARSLTAYLRDHPTRFRAAMERLRPELKGLYLAAWQSWVWNQALALWFEENLPAADLIRLPGRLARWPAPLRADPAFLENWRAKRIELPCRRAHLPADHPDRALFDRVLAPEGLKLDDLRVPGTRELFFSRGVRPAHLPVGDLKLAWRDDEHHPGQLAAELGFRLPKSSYATMLVKRLQAAVGDTEVSPPGTEGGDTDPD